MARQLWGELVGELQPYTRCSMEKGRRKAIPSTITMRATKKLERVYVDLSENKNTAFLGGVHSCMIIRDYRNRCTWL